MSAEEKMALARWAIERAKRGGAREVAVDVSSGREVGVKFRDGRIEELTESVQSSLSAALYVEGRYSAHTTSDLRKESLEPFLAEAIALTKELNEDPFRSLPDASRYAGRRDAELGIEDPGYAEVRPEERVALAKKLEGLAKKKSRKLVSVTGYVGDGRWESVKAHSNGFEGSRARTSFFSGAEATVGDKNGGRPADESFASTCLRKDLAAPEFLADDAVKRALRKVGQSKLESGAYDMLVENRAAAKLLWALYAPMQGRSLQQKSSFLEGKLGERVASDQLTFVDDPFLPGGLGSRTYDDDGLAAERRTFIERGTLKAYFIDDYYGKKLGVEPTTGGPANVLLEGGKGTPEELLRGVKKGIFVTSFLGGNSNATTGDFSFGIVGLLIADGRLVKPVNEMNVSGNLGGLWRSLDAVGGDPYPFSSWRLPSLRFRDAQFSGV